LIGPCPKNAIGGHTPSLGLLCDPGAPRATDDEPIGHLGGAATDLSMSLLLDRSKLEHVSEHGDPDAG
jgi:hypothetical protein